MLTVNVEIFKLIGVAFCLAQSIVRLPVDEFLLAPKHSVAATAWFDHFVINIQVGDSIVRKSRETLERAIHLVENTQRWCAKVVYGDTDRFVTPCDFTLPTYCMLIRSTFTLPLLLSIAIAKISVSRYVRI